MIEVMFVPLVAALVGIWLVQRRVRRLEGDVRRLESLLLRLEDRLARGAAPHAGEPQHVPAEPLCAPPQPALATPTTPPAPPPEPKPERRFSFETLVGGRLPIWIGGAALVLAGFFLVRYSLETGLIGPLARTLLAAVFALLLLGGSEVARRIPALAQDPRVGQALAGAGIASAYGTLYIAAALYDLVTPFAAFVLMLGVTGVALALALRHGPPTAVMAFAGGFAAPLVAGFDSAGIGPLLGYLGLFIIALFGLAVRRGWAWLALAAAVAGFGWINFLIYALEGSDLSLVGLFAVLLAAGASLALPATGAQRPWLRLAPLVAGCVQLVVLAPALDFDGLAWSFYCVLAAAAVVLAWRDRVFLPGALAALALLLLLEGIAFSQGERAATPLAAAAATLFFALPGHWRARDGEGWAALAAGATAGPLLVAHGLAPALLAPPLWAVLELAAALACAHLAWRGRGPEDNVALIGGTAAAALLAVVGCANFLPAGWLALPLALAMIALAAWARHAGAPRLYALPALPFAAALLAAAVPITEALILVAASAIGNHLSYPLLPDLSTLLRALALPAAAAGLLLIDPRQFGRARASAEIAALAAAVLVAYALAKQPLAIAQEPAFVAWGFAERALITQAFLAAGFLLARSGRFVSLGRILLALGLARFLWFDLFALNPVAVPQQVGAIPLLNAAALHPLAAALWLRLALPGRTGPVAAAALLLVALCAAVRQAAHGTLLTGPVTLAENYGYSVVLLGLALFWLWRGIAAGSRPMRLAGLGLLTFVTLKVFLVDASALDGVLRILSFLGLGLALIGIGWAYGRFLGKAAETTAAA